MKSTARRIALETLGWVLVVAGIAALVLPGPGLLGIFAGLVLLSQQYDWAEKRLEPVKKRAMKAAAEGVETWPRIVLSTGLAVGLIAIGIVWSWSPPAPGWWPIDDKWWLIGGWGTGSTQIISGLIAIAMIGYSYRRFRIRGEDPEEV
jgi:hypothetical protein